MIIIKFRINRMQVVSTIGLINLEINNLLIMLRENIMNKLFIAHSCNNIRDNQLLENKNFCSKSHRRILISFLKNYFQSI